MFFRKLSLWKHKALTIKTLDWSFDPKSTGNPNSNISFLIYNAKRLLGSTKHFSSVYHYHVKITYLYDKIIEFLNSTKIWTGHFFSKIRRITKFYMRIFVNMLILNIIKDAIAAKKTQFWRGIATSDTGSDVCLLKWMFLISKTPSRRASVGSVSEILLWKVKTSTNTRTILYLTRFHQPRVA